MLENTWNFISFCDIIFEINEMPSRMNSYTQFLFDFVYFVCGFNRDAESIMIKIDERAQNYSGYVLNVDDGI